MQALAGSPQAPCTYLLAGSYLARQSRHTAALRWVATCQVLPFAHLSQPAEARTGRRACLLTMPACLGLVRDAPPDGSRMPAAREPVCMPAAALLPACLQPCACTSIARDWRVHLMLMACSACVHAHARARATNMSCCPELQHVSHTSTSQHQVFHLPTTNAGGGCGAAAASGPGP